jgi:predicted metalloendopeptidase
MQFQVGYSADVKSVVSLADTFGDITILPDDFFGNRIRCQQHQINQLWKQLDHPIDKQRWDLNAQSTTIFYNKEQNKVGLYNG